MSLRPLFVFSLLVPTAACAGQMSVTGQGVTTSQGAPPARAAGHGQAEAEAHAEVSVDVRIEFFGISLDGADDVVFVLDRSGSMSGIATGFSGRDVGMSPVGSALAGLGGAIANEVAGQPMPSKMEAAKQELIDALNQMPDGTRVGVIFFDDEIATLTRRMTTLTPESRARMIGFVSGIEASGSTAAVPALALAYQMGARRVMLLSDGLANNGGDGDDLLRDARHQIAGGVRFDTVGIGIDQDAELLRTLAVESGGVAVVR